MRRGRGTAGALILAEIIILIAAVALGVARKVRPEEYPADGNAAATGTEYGNWTIDSSAVASAEHLVRGEAEPSDGAAVPLGEELDTLSEEIKQKLSAMTLEEKVAQMFFVSPEELTGNDLVNIAGAGTRDAINTYPVGGLVYTRDNYQGREQFQRLLSNAGDFSNERTGLYLFFAADGGGLTVLSENYQAEPLRDMFAANKISAEGDMLLTPVVFPDHRDTVTADTKWVQLSDQSAAVLEGAEDVPCSLSGEAVSTLRTTLGYQGIILTGNLSEESITTDYTAAQAAVLAVQAGVDMLYCPTDFTGAYEAVLAAVQHGEIPIERIDLAVGHILTQKFKISDPISNNAEANGGEAVADENPGEEA